MVLFGGEQSGAHAGAAVFCQKITLERSIHADASVRRRVCGKSRVRDSAAISHLAQSAPPRRAVAVCARGARGSKLAVRAGGETYLGAPCIGHGPEEKRISCILDIVMGISRVE